MKHRIFGKKLGRNHNERKALFSSLTKAMFISGSINTTQARATAIVSTIESLSNTIITKPDLVARRELFRVLQDQTWVNNVVTKFERFAVNYNSDGIGHIVNDLSSKNIVFLKNETLLHLENYLTNYKSFVFRSNRKPNEPKKKNKPKWFYFKLDIKNNDLYYVVYETTDKKMYLYSVVDRLP